MCNRVIGLLYCGFRTLVALCITTNGDCEICHCRVLDHFLYVLGPRNENQWLHLGWITTVQLFIVVSRKLPVLLEPLSSRIRRIKGLSSPRMARAPHESRRQAHNRCVILMIAARPGIRAQYDELEVWLKYSHHTSHIYAETKAAKSAIPNGNFRTLCSFDPRLKNFHSPYYTSLLTNIRRLEILDTINTLVAR